MYVESKRARIEREREERRRREEVRVEFSAEELALATIPGADFDPARRQFSMEELKPQPIIRKRRKVNLVKPFFVMRKIDLNIMLSLEIPLTSPNSFHLSIGIRQS